MNSLSRTCLSIGLMSTITAIARKSASSFHLHPRCLLYARSWSRMPVPIPVRVDDISASAWCRFMRRRWLGSEYGPQDSGLKVMWQNTTSANHRGLNGYEDTRPSSESPAHDWRAILLLSPTPPPPPLALWQPWVSGQIGIWPSSGNPEFRQTSDQPFFSSFAFSSTANDNLGPPSRLARHLDAETLDVTQTALHLTPKVLVDGQQSKDRTNWVNLLHCWAAENATDETSLRMSLCFNRNHDHMRRLGQKWLVMTALLFRREVIYLES